MADFPLYKHGNGQWCKSIRGKKCYFGTDPDAALARYLDEKDHLFAGRPRVVKHELPTLGALCNLFLASVKWKVAAGELTERSRKDYLSTLTRLVEFRGKDDHPGFWTPGDFSLMKVWLFEPVERKTPIRGGLKGPSVSKRSPVTVSNDQARIRAFLNWCYVSEYLPQPRYGKEFGKLTVKQRRAAKSQLGQRDMPSEDVRRVVEKATVHFRPIVLLGINGGMGATDISLLTQDQFDGGEWLTCPRSKTGVSRRFCLWPETRAAIDEYERIRKLPISHRNADLMFLTGHRDAWVRDGYDAIGKAFGKLARELGISSSFYDLRRTFQTVAEETLDFPAVNHCMGHVATSGDMSAVYRQRISDARIATVCGHVHKWLFVH